MIQQNFDKPRPRSSAVWESTAIRIRLPGSGRAAEHAGRQGEAQSSSDPPTRTCSVRAGASVATRWAQMAIHLRYPCNKLSRV
jgi:hypothetical protein